VPVNTVLHQPLLAAEGQPSPFDLAIREIVAGQNVVLAAPYLSWKYLRALAGLARGWRLITDAEEWLSNEPKPAEAMAFMLAHQDRIHHCPDLHAKVVASQQRALVGSANLTRKGLTGRQEMGVLLDDPHALTQLWGWFDGLWKETAPPHPEDLPPLIAAMPPRRPPAEEKVRLRSPYKGVRTTLLTKLNIPEERRVSTPRKPKQDVPKRQKEAKPGKEQKGQEDLLVERLRSLAKSREEAAAFLALLAWPLQVHGVIPGDTRVVVSAPQTESELNLHFNSWQVVSWKENARVSLLVEAIHFPEIPVDFVSREVSLQEGPFQWQYFTWAPGKPLPERVVSSWKKACGEALRQGEKSFHRRWHHPLLATILLESAAREELLRRAFSSHQGPLPLVDSHKGFDPEESALALVCQQMSSRAANTFFDLVSLFLDISGLDENDPRLACTIRKDFSGITVQIGSRYVLKGYAKYPKYQGHFGMIAPSSLASKVHLFPEAIHFSASEFARGKGEKETMGYLYFSLASVDKLPEGLRMAWSEGIQHELARGILAPQRGRHRPVVLAAARDAVVRARVLREAFPVLP
jgi:hypothetical protein